MFISWQTYEGIKITVHPSIELIKYLLIQGVQYVLTERFCQDSVENYFGRERSVGRRKDNPSLHDCRNEDPQLAKIDVETVPCRKSNRK